VEIENEHGLSELLDGPALVQASSGYTFTEGPVWVPDADCLIFSDIPTSVAYRWRAGALATGPAPVFRQQTGSGNGMTLDQEGRVICCEQSSRRVVRFPFDDPSAIEVIAERYGGSRLNSPNDVVVDAAGRVYFTDPIYGLGPGGEGKEQSHNGVYRIDPDGEIVLIDDRFQQPNGLVFSPDERFLYIGDSQQLVIRRFALQPDGSLTGGGIVSDMRKSSHSGGPDGMTMDTDGRLWTTGPGGIWVVDVDGTNLGQIPMTEQPSNVTFGGHDFSTLFITAETSLYRIPTRVRGAVPGSRLVGSQQLVR
jgi:sugar lactone lactonase YvrE